MLKKTLLKITVKILLTTLLMASNAYANDEGGIGLDVTRVVFPASAESVSLRANNTASNNVWLLRARTSDYYSNGTKTPFFITPRW